MFWKNMDQLWLYTPAWLDALLIAPFRWPLGAMGGFLIGSFCLAMYCVVIGELTLSLAIRFNRGHIDRLKAEMKERESLSYLAYESGDKEGYKAINKQANDAWGKHFFNMMAYSAGMLWPVPFALAWMHGRFYGVDLPLPWPLSLVFGLQVGYGFYFIPLYILGRILFGRLRKKLPYFKGVQKMLDEV
jgi:hypothetical protein